MVNFLTGTTRILPILESTSWPATVSWMLTEEQETLGSETKDFLLLGHQAARTLCSPQFSLSPRFHQFSSVHFNHSVMSDSLWPHRLQHTRLPCPLPAPRVYSNSCPSSQWFHPTISSSVIPFFCLQSFPASRSFSNESVLCIRWPQYWCFSPSNEYSGLISFRIDWFDLLAVQETIKESSPTPQFESINSSVLNFLYSLTLTSIHGVTHSGPGWCSMHIEFVL